jgi:cytoskeletal protein RodZ
MIDKIKDSENLKSGIGSLLKETRLAKGLTLSNVVQITRIRLNYINALENDDYKELPERTYTIGYLRKYAELLDIDAEMLIAKIEENYKFVEPFKGKFVEKYSDSINENLESADKVFIEPIVENTNKDNSNPMISQFYKNKQLQKEKDKEKKYKEENKFDNGFQNNIIIHNIVTNIKPIIIILVCILVSIVFIYTVFFNSNKADSSKKILNVDTNEKSLSDEDNKESEFLELDQDKRNKITEEALNTDEENVEAKDIANASSVSVNNDVKAKEKTIDPALPVEKQVSWPVTDEASRITIKVTSKSWIKIYNKEKNEYYFDKILSDGAMIQVPGGLNDLLLTVGDYTGVVLIVDGIEVALQKKGKSSVMRGIKLESEFLLNKFGVKE